MPADGKITTATFPDFSKNVLNKYLDEGKTEVEDVRSQIYKVNSTGEFYIQERSYYGPSVMSPTAEFGLIPFEGMSPAGNRTLTAAKWSLGMRYSDEQVLFDKYDLVNPGRELGRVEGLTEQVLAVLPLLKGLTTGTATGANANYAGLDGHFLFSGTHPIWGTGGTYSNRIATTLAYSYLGVQEAYDIMNLVPDANGFITSHTIDKLVVPVAKQLVSREIFGSTLNPTNSSNATNVFNNILTLGDVVHWGMLDKYASAYSYTYPWFARAKTHDLRWYNHRAPRMQTWRSNETESTRVSRSILCSFGHFDWRGWVGAPTV